MSWPGREVNYIVGLLYIVISESKFLNRLSMGRLKISNSNLINFTPLKASFQMNETLNHKIVFRYDTIEVLTKHRVVKPSCFVFFSRSKRGHKIMFYTILTSVAYTSTVKLDSLNLKKKKSWWTWILFPNISVKFSGIGFQTSKI